MGPADYYSQVMEATCTWRVACPSAYARYASVADCMRWADPDDYRGHAGSVSAAISRGTAVFDADLAQRCLDWVAAAPCTEDATYTMFVAHPECSAVFQGLVADGGVCYVSEECDYGRCLSGGGGYSCPGRCEAYARLGDPCGGYPVDAECGPGLQCNGDVCLIDEPTTFAGLGEPCSYYSENCAPGRRCDSSGTDSVCATLLPLGSECSSDGECEVGLECIGDGYAGACQQIVLVTREGEACGGTRVCDESRGLSCDTLLGWCTGLPGVDQPCLDGICREGLYCDETGAPLCRNLLLDGAACESSSACRSHVCNSSGVCQPAGFCA
jgi:hypothetical protein